jgi:hypothetical protein
MSRFCARCQSLGILIITTKFENHVFYFYFLALLRQGVEIVNLAIHHWILVAEGVEPQGYSRNQPMRSLDCPALLLPLYHSNAKKVKYKCHQSLLQPTHLTTNWNSYALTVLQLIARNTDMHLCSLASESHSSITPNLYPLLNITHPWEWKFPELDSVASRSILILSTHLRLGLPSGLFPSGFHTNNLYEFLFSPIRAAWPTHFILLELIL